MSSVRHHIIPAVIIILMAAVSCSGRRNKAERKDIIPVDDLTSILADSYLADGLLAIPEIRYKFNEGDTLQSYIDIIEDHGYTKDEMDRTMRYYFIRKPKELVKIYDKALGKLSEMESIADKDLLAFSSRNLNLWPGERFFHLPGPDSTDIPWIDIKGDFYGTIHLSFTITIYPGDQTADPHVGLYFSRLDSGAVEKRAGFTPIRLLKDGRPHSYSLTMLNPFPGTSRLRGWFTGEALAPDLIYHQWISNVVLARSRIAQ
ncbi:MAG: DUF4296 domain-containing protein [Bacteroidales bacterium]